MVTAFHGLKSVIMNRFFLLCLVSVSTVLSGQDAAPPHWYLDELRYQVGTWTTSNEAWVSDQEPMTDYRVEWNWGEHRNTLKGRLYGMIKGKPTRSFWEFYQYWDPARQQAVFQQTGQDGTTGIGTLSPDGPGKIKLVQTFTGPDGRISQMGHRHQILDEDRYQGDSFLIDSVGTWLPGRRYTWNRVPLEGDSTCTCCKPSFTDFDFWLGEWNVTDTSGAFLGTNRIERQLDRCLLLENWSSKGLNRGKSMNYYDAADSLWHQLWIDNQGGILNLSGILIGTDMVLESDWQSGSEASRFKHRITWSPQPDGTVIQTWDMLDAEGQILQTLFRGIYTKWPRVGE